MGIQGNWAKDDMFPEVTKKIRKERESMEMRMRKEKEMEERKIRGDKRQKIRVAKIEKRLSKPLFKKGRTTKSRGKGLRISTKQATRGLFKLI